MLAGRQLGALLPELRPTPPDATARLGLASAFRSAADAAFSLNLMPLPHVVHRWCRPRAFSRLRERMATSDFACRHPVSALSPRIALARKLQKSKIRPDATCSASARAAPAPRPPRLCAARLTRPSLAPDAGARPCHAGARPAPMRAHWRRRRARVRSACAGRHAWGGRPTSIVWLPGLGRGQNRLSVPPPCVYRWAGAREPRF